MKNYGEICLKFPYLENDGTDELLFMDGTASSLKTYIDSEHVCVSVTWYETIGEYQDAITKGSVKYTMVDPMCCVGQVTAFDPVTHMMTMRVDERYAAAMSGGKVVPRCIVNKHQHNGSVEMELVKLICIDILQK